MFQETYRQGSILWLGSSELGAMLICTLVFFSLAESGHRKSLLTQSIIFF